MFVHRVNISSPVEEWGGWPNIIVRRKFVLLADNIDDVRGPIAFSNQTATAQIGGNLRRNKRVVSNMSSQRYVFQKGLIFRLTWLINYEIMVYLDLQLEYKSFNCTNYILSKSTRPQKLKKPPEQLLFLIITPMMTAMRIVERVLSQKLRPPNCKNSFYHTVICRGGDL